MTQLVTGKLEQSTFPAVGAGEPLPDLIFVSMEDWDEIWRRNQFVCSEFARRHPQMKILFVGLPRNVSHDLRHGRPGTLSRRATHSVMGLPNVFVTHALKLFPNTLTIGRKLNDLIARRHIRRVARQLGITRPILWLNPHSAVHMVGQIGEQAVIYDITDDWISLTQKRALRELTTRQDAELCRRADAVIVCSKKLLELKQNRTSNLHLVPNGVDAAHYRMVLDGAGPLPAEAAGWPRPVLGYTGTIHPDRVDVGLVARIARAMPAGSVVLVGPNLLGEADTAAIAGCPNVFLHGQVPYSQIPMLMRCFDICITPHRVNSFTESLSPIKLWEYLAAGKPIVSTDVAGFRDYPQLVRIASDAPEFVQAVDQSMKEDPALPQARRAEAMGHSWSARVDLIESVIRGCLAPKK